MERIETVIVGGGQAGLATSYYLTQQGREHIVLEQAAQAAPRLAQRALGFLHPGHAELGAQDARRRVRRR